LEKVMSDSKEKIEDLASQYLNLWQKQFKNHASDKMMKDTFTAMNQMNAGAQELMKSFDTPEKTQEWITTWADSWKAQFNNGTEQHPAFTFAQANGATSSSAASGNTAHEMDDLTQRIALLEERLQQLESRLKD
jgi:hypothetical protein